MNDLAQKFKGYPVAFWLVYTSETHPEFVVESSWVIETYDARRQRARNFLWQLDYMGMPLQLELLVDNNVRKQVWSQFPYFSSEVRAKYGWGQGAWIIDLKGKIVASEAATKPQKLDQILSDIFGLKG